MHAHGGCQFYSFQLAFFSSIHFNGFGWVMLWHPMAMQNRVVAMWSVENGARCWFLVLEMHGERVSKIE